MSWKDAVPLQPSRSTEVMSAGTVPPGGEPFKAAPVGAPAGIGLVSAAWDGVLSFPSFAAGGAVEFLWCMPFFGLARLATGGVAGFLVFRFGLRACVLDAFLF